MSKIQNNRRPGKVRVLGASVSTLVLGTLLAGSAMAQCSGAAVTINGPASGAYTGPNYNLDTGTAGGTTYTTCPTSTTVASGTAVVIPSWGYLGTVQNNGWVPVYDINGAVSTTSGAPQGGDIVGQINVAQGATLVFGGEQSIYGGAYEPLNSMINAAGNVVFEGNGGFEGSNQYGLTGTNTMTGDVTLEAGANVRVGEYYGTTTGTFGSYAAGGYYAASTINFGTNTNVSLEGTTGTFSDGTAKDALLFLNLDAPAVIGGYLAATAQSEVWLNAGTLVVNGANTTANPFVGTLQLDPGTTFIVGDSSHPGAVFGDPNNTDGSTETLNIQRTSNGVDTLEGYGTIYATVNNSGIVTPGGTAGTIGSLTVSKYVQTSTGILNIEVTPTGASELKVLGNATLAGTLDLKIDPGAYGNNVIQILSAGSITGSFSSIETSGSEAAGLAIEPTAYYVVTELTSSSQVFGHLVDADATHINAFADTLYDVLADGSPSNASKTDVGNGNSIWLQPYGSTSHVSNDGTGYSTSGGGVNGGWIHRSTGAWDGLPGISNAAAGVAVSFGHEDLKTDASQTTAGSNTFDGAVFTGFDLENAHIDGMFFYNTYKSDVVRNLGSSGSIASSPKATSEGGSLQISGGLFNNVVEPYIRATYANIDQTAVTEQGANLLALSVDAIDKDFFYTDLGVKLHPDMSSLAGIHPELTLAVEHNFTYHPGDEVVAQFANLSGSAFTYDWKGDQATAGIIGLNLSSDVSSHLQVYGKLDGRFTIHGSTGDLRAGVKYQF